MTHTFAILGISSSAYEEIKALLKQAGYYQVIMNEGENNQEVIDMHGLALAIQSPELESEPIKEDYMSALQELLKECEALNPDTFSGNLLAQARHELEKYSRSLNVIMCAYCGHESPKSNLAAVIEHTMNCDKRPERMILEKAFEIEDRLYQRIIHLSKKGYSPERCEICVEIAESLRIYQEHDNQKE